MPLKESGTNKRKAQDAVAAAATSSNAANTGFIAGTDGSETRAVQTMDGKELYKLWREVFGVQPPYLSWVQALINAERRHPSALGNLVTQMVHRKVPLRPLLAPYKVLAYIDPKYHEASSPGTRFWTEEQRRLGGLSFGRWTRTTGSSGGSGGNGTGSGGDGGGGKKRKQKGGRAPIQRKEKKAEIRPARGEVVVGYLLPDGHPCIPDGVLENEEWDQLPPEERVYLYVGDVHEIGTVNDYDEKLFPYGDAADMQRIEAQEFLQSGLNNIKYRLRVSARDTERNDDSSLSFAALVNKRHVEFAHRYPLFLDGLKALLEAKGLRGSFNPNVENKEVGSSGVSLGMNQDDRKKAGYQGLLQAVTTLPGMNYVQVEAHTAAFKQYGGEPAPADADALKKALAEARAARVMVTDADKCEWDAEQKLYVVPVEWEKEQTQEEIARRVPPTKETVRAPVMLYDPQDIVHGSSMVTSTNAVSKRWAPVVVYVADQREDSPFAGRVVPHAQILIHEQRLATSAPSAPAYARDRYHRLFHRAWVRAVVREGLFHEASKTGVTTYLQPGSKQRPGLYLIHLQPQWVPQAQIETVEVFSFVPGSGGSARLVPADQLQIAEPATSTATATAGTAPVDIPHSLGSDDTVLVGDEEAGDAMDAEEPAGGERVAAAHIEATA